MTPSPRAPGGIGDGAWLRWPAWVSRQTPRGYYPSAAMSRWSRWLEAHANLLRSEPVIGAVLHEAPRRMQLWFSEEPEPRFSEVALFDATRQRLTDAPAQVAPGRAAVAAA